ncbi:magnesium transporter [Marinimicrobium sp. ABcell2]|uniref:magnesium transporter n=1 Tax=Marinimicrobium sp. ABcell2 TaxID=3069751 RepID=UPI0027AFD203|nr:magnesium transporter [Marinimicrobium sp. ABcell2]MDQ2075798.1 magnesium transporter [Marinimicrobium sp. ABcell2]
MLLDSEALEARAAHLANLLTSGALEEAAREQDNVSPMRISQTLKEMHPEDVAEFVRLIGWVRGGNLVAYFPSEILAQFLKVLDAEEAATLSRHLPAARIADVLPSLSESLRSAVLERLPQEMRSSVERLEAYESDTAGAEMSPLFLSVRAGATISATQAAVQAMPPEHHRSAYVYVVDEHSRLKGVISLRELMLANPGDSVDRVMIPDIFAVRDDDSALEAAKRIRTRGLRMLPVVDANDRLVGVISIERAMDLLSSELAGSFLGIGGATEESFFTSPKRAVGMRLPWMAANVFLNLGAVWVITGFEATIEQVAILAAFLPMITDMGGNVGIQALSVSIRSMALGEARVRDVWRALRKELMIGMVNGLALGLLFGVIVMVMQQNLTLAVVASLALSANVVIAGAVGGTIPFLIKRLGYDPAMMTGPVLTTITDISGVTVYLGLSTVFLSALLIV